MKVKKVPRISLVTCSYQQGKYIEETIQSVLRQQYPDLEYIVVDGGSTDGTVEILKKHASSFSWWVSERDAGQTDALIKGFARSTGEIHGWLCSDDLLLPGALAKVAEFFENHPEVDFVYGDAIWIDGESKPIRLKREIGWSRFIFLFDHNYLPQPSCFWRSRLYTQVGGLARERHYSMDSDLWLKFARITKPVHLPVVLSAMRLYAEQKSTAGKPAGRREHESLRHLEMPRISKLPLGLLRPVARIARVVRKAIGGSYRGSVRQLDL